MRTGVPAAGGSCECCLLAVQQREASPRLPRQLDVFSRVRPEKLPTDRLSQGREENRAYVRDCAR